MAPSTVRYAVAALWALVGLLVLRTLLTFVMFDSLMDAWVESRNSGLPREAVEDGAPAYRPIAVASLVVVGVPLAVCAVMVGRGRGWARVVATVFGVLGVLGGLIALLQPSTGLFRVLGLAQALLSGIVLVLLWLGQSNAYFRSARAG